MGSSARGLRRFLGGATFTLVIGALTLAPVIYVIAASFDVADLGAPYHFGFDGWHDIFRSTRTLTAIGYSFLLVIRVPIALVVAFVIAWLLVRVRLPGHRFIELAFWFGFLLPIFPMMMGWILLLDGHYGLLNLALEKLPFVSGPIFSIYSIPGILWVHLVLTTVPIMVILLTPMLRQLDAGFEEAADMAGASTLADLALRHHPAAAARDHDGFRAGADPQPRSFRDRARAGRAGEHRCLRHAHLRFRQPRAAALPASDGAEHRLPRDPAAARPRLSGLYCTHRRPRDRDQPRRGCRRGRKPGGRCWLR